MPGSPFCLARSMPMQALFLFLFLLASNRHFSLRHDADFIATTAGDVRSYAAIAQAAPGLPREKLLHHHAQRFAVPALAGLTGRVLGIPPEWVMRGITWSFLYTAIALTLAFARRRGIGPGISWLLTATVFLNPYLSRIGIALPYMGNDLGFVLGSILFLKGLTEGSPAQLWAGCLLSIACRQTALLFLPALVCSAVKPFPSPLPRRHSLGAAMILILGYVATSRIALLGSEPARNLEIVTSLYRWLTQEFDLAQLVLEFGLRGLAAFAVPFAATVFLTGKPMGFGSGPGALGLPHALPSASRFGACREKGTPTLRLGWVFLATGGLILAQPLGGGPGYGNFPRLGVLGLWPLVFGWVLLATASTPAWGSRLSKLQVGGMSILLALHSFHHLFSLPGALLLTAKSFFIAQLGLACLLLAPSLSDKGFKPITGFDESAHKTKPTARPKAARPWRRATKEEPPPTRGTGILEGWLARQRHARVIAALSPEHRYGKVLDLGCGSYPGFLVRSPFKMRVALDRRPPLPAPGVQRVVQDLSHPIPFRDSSFDCVTAMAVAEHLPVHEVLALFQECRRILKPGGQLVLTTPHAFADGLIKLLAKANLISREEIDEHQSHFRGRDLKRLLERAGFAAASISVHKFQFGLNLAASAEKCPLPQSREPGMASTSLLE